MTKRTIIDRFVEWRDPLQGLKRAKARQRLNALNGFTGASKSRKSLWRWGNREIDPGQQLLDDYSILVERSIDLDRNNPVGHGAITTYSDNVIGTGLRVQSQIDNEFLKIDDIKAEQLQRDFERIFNNWADSLDCDAKREQRFADIQATAFVSMLLTGDGCAQRQYRSKSNRTIKTCYRLIDSLRVSNPDRAMDSDTLAGGIERNEFGEPVRYYIASVSPGNRHRSQTWAPVNRWSTNGRLLDFIHVHTKRLPGEPRGRPVLTPVIEAFRQVGKYTDAELEAAVVSGLFTVFIKSETGDTDIDGYSGDAAASSAELEDPDYSLGKGSVVQLAEDEDISTANPGRPNEKFHPFVDAIYSQIGAGLGIPKELLLKQFVSSYSAAKGALNEAHRLFKTRRSFFGKSFCQPIYEAVISEAIAKGLVQAPGFFSNADIRDAYLKSRWVGDAYGTLDPLKDVAAAEKRLSIGITTKTQETLEYNGGDFDKNVKQRRKEADQEQGLGAPDERNTSDEPKSVGDGADSPANNDGDREQNE